MLNNVQKKLGYREVYYNVSNDGFWTVAPGDHYEQLTIAGLGGGATSRAATFAFDAHVIPTQNATYDIGSAEYKVRHLFLSDNSVRFESGNLGVDGGNLTFNGESLLTSNRDAILAALGVLPFEHKNFAIGAGLNVGEVFFNTSTNKLEAVHL